MNPILINLLGILVGVLMVCLILCLVVSCLSMLAPSFRESTRQIMTTFSDFQQFLLWRYHKNHKGTTEDEALNKLTETEYSLQVAERKFSFMCDWFKNEMENGRRYSHDRHMDGLRDFWNKEKLIKQGAGK